MQARGKLAEMLNLGLTPQERPQCNRETMSSGLGKKTSGMGHAVRQWRLVLYLLGEQKLAQPAGALPLLRQEQERLLRPVGWPI